MVVRIGSTDIMEAIKEWLEKRNLKMGDACQWQAYSAHYSTFENTGNVRVEIQVEAIEVKSGPYR